MKIVIDIPEEEYEWLKQHPNSIRWSSVYTDAILNGTPLNETLDKIRAEIQENINYNKKMNYQGIVTGLLLTLDIIDKHEAESDEV